METENNGHDNGRDQKGKFLPGNPGKQKGTPKNIMRDEIKNFLNDNWKEFPNWFEALKPKEKIEVILDLMPYAVSRLQSVAMSDSDGNDLPKDPGIDYSKLSDATLLEIISLQEKTKIELSGQG